MFEGNKKIVVALTCTALLATLWVLQPDSERKPRSFDEIRVVLEGKVASQVVLILGEPDTRQKVFGGERWIWWRFTYLEGNDYPPENRGHVGHLEIFFQAQPEMGNRGEDPLDALGIDRDLGVRYLPVEKHN